MKGEIVIPLEYDNGCPFSEGIAAVCIQNQSSKWGYIDQNNHEVLSFRYDLADSFNNGIARVGLYGKCSKTSSCE